MAKFGYALLLALWVASSLQIKKGKQNVRRAEKDQNLIDSNFKFWVQVDVIKIFKEGLEVICLAHASTLKNVSHFVHRKWHYLGQWAQI